MEAESKIIKLNERIDQMADCLRLDCGSGHFPPIPEFMQAVKSIVPDLKNKYHGYLPSSGLLELREQISKLDEQTGGESITAEQILITHGALHGVYLALTALCNIGDEVLVNDIHFEGFSNLAQTAGLMVKTCDFSNSKSLEKAVQAKTKIIILNSPENPTGKIYSQSEIELLVNITRKRKIWLISDEVTNQIIYSGNVWNNIRKLAPDRIITVNSFSKNFFLPGLRVGWIMAPPNLVKKFAAALSSQTVCVNRFGQLVANEMLKQLPDKKLPSSYITKLEKRRDAIGQALRQAGFKVNLPLGGANFFLDVGIPSEQFADHLLSQNKVAVVPGVYFGPTGENHIRIGFGELDLDNYSLLVNTFKECQTYLTARSK